MKIDWNCSFKVFAQSDVADLPELVLSIGMVVSSLRKALIYVAKMI